MEICKPKSLNQRFNWSLTPINPLHPIRCAVFTFFICLLLAPILATAQCAPEAQARISAEHRSLDFTRKSYPAGTDWEKSKRQFADNVNNALPREVASAKQDGVWNSKNPQYKLNTERRIAEYKAQIDRSRQNQSRSSYPSDIANMERGISEALYRICLLQESLKAVDSSIPSGGSSQTASAGIQVPAQSETQSTQQQSQQSQQAQQQAQQAQEAARVAQTRADQARQGKRKTHDPAAEAHQCIEIDKDPGLFGAFKNTCGYKVNFSTCNYRPRVRQGGFNWSADFDCEQQKFGLHTPDGGRAVASHNRNTEMVYWFACKAPAFPVDTEFVNGGGVRGRCN